MDISALWSAIQSGGVPGLLLLMVIVGFYGNNQGWWISQREAQALRDNAARFEDLLREAVAKAETQAQIARDQVALIERLVESRGGGPRRIR